MKGNSNVSKSTKHKIVSGGTTISNPAAIKLHPKAGSKRGVSAKGK